MRISSSFLSLASTLASSTLALGCMTELDGTEDTTGDEALGEIESSLSLARWFWSWGTTAGPDVDIGPASDRTCFLAGAAGNLNAGWGWDNGGSPSIAGVRISGGRWLLSGTGGRDEGNTVIGNPVNARAVCIGTTANRTMYSDGGPGHFLNHKMYLEPVKAGRTCMLARVSGYSGSWSSSSARVQLIQQNGSWYLESANIVMNAGIPRIDVVCVDLPRGTWVGTGSWGAANPGSGTFPVLSEATAGVCGLTGISGPMKYNEWDDGAMLAWPASSPGTWTIRVEDGKRGYVTCLH